MGEGPPAASRHPAGLLKSAAMVRWALAAILTLWVLAYPAYFLLVPNVWGLVLLLFPWLLGIVMLASLVWVTSRRPRRK